jgi:L-ascorbate 6-phosphate lactonase
MAKITPHDVRRDSVNAGQVAIWWLGQAGFLFKSVQGQVVAIDPYLSNSCLVSHGLQRRIPVPISPLDIPAELILISHWHPDHLDPETIRPLNQLPDVHIVGPASCIRRCQAWGVSDDRLHALKWGETFLYQDVSVTSVMARHMNPGALCEDASGYLIDLGGIRVYHTGDTEYDVGLRSLAHSDVDIMLTCCTGTGRTLDAQEAAWLASRVRPRLLIPMHFGMFDYSNDPSATDDPMDLIGVYRRLVDDPRVVIPQVGKRILFERGESILESSPH